MQGTGCDNCPGQQKNEIVLGCISKCLSDMSYIKKVSINFSTAGHTKMIVDSVHAY